MKKTNNKGFSLVELIIVVAIMAILIGVLAPQYIKYVEKSRKSADVQLIESCKTALQVSLTDDDYSISDGTGVVSISDTGTSVDSSAPDVATAFDDYFGVDVWEDKKFKSKTCDGVTVTLDITGDSNVGFKVVVQDMPADLE